MAMCFLKVRDSIAVSFSYVNTLYLSTLKQYQNSNLETRDQYFYKNKKKYGNEIAAL